MTESLQEPVYRTRRIQPSDPKCGFRCGKHPLDDYFRRHALSNDQGNIGRAYVFEASVEERAAGFPLVLGFYTLSMASVVSVDINSVIVRKLPRYPMPVALIGRLAVDERARGRRLGETLLLDALLRVVTVAEIVGCLGVIVDAKDDSAIRFYEKYDFKILDETSWPRRMFLAVETAQSAFLDNNTDGS